MTGRLRHKTALVTGAASGIGRQSAVRMAEEGALVCITDIDDEGLAGTLALMAGRGFSLHHDVTQEESWRAAIAMALERDVGVILMRPLGGSGRMSTIRSRMAEGYRGTLTPENLLHYVLSHPGVSVAIPGARYPSRIGDNVAAVAQGRLLSESEQRQCEEEAESLY